uniref:Uncharacterized protein n=2 Tax=Cacopsylla melanoneura TaxID=428564 RepID=A0A8D9AR12_9HEMI
MTLSSVFLAMSKCLGICNWLSNGNSLIKRFHFSCTLGGGHSSQSIFANHNSLMNSLARIVTGLNSPSTSNIRAVVLSIFRFVHFESCILTVKKNLSSAGQYCVPSTLRVEFLSHSTFAMSLCFSETLSSNVTLLLANLVSSKPPFCKTFTHSANVLTACSSSRKLDK